MRKVLMLMMLIFSTYVEVFLLHHRWPRRHHHFLHVCGGVSRVKVV